METLDYMNWTRGCFTFETPERRTAWTHTLLHSPVHLQLLVGGVFTHFAVTRQCAKRWGHGENPVPGATKQTREEMNTSPLFFFFLSTTLALLKSIHTSPSAPPSLFLCYSTTPGIKLIIQKVTCSFPLSLLSPLPAVSLHLHWEKKEKTSPREFQSWSPRAGSSGSHTSVSSSHRKFLSHHFLVSFIHLQRWKGDRDYSAAEICTPAGNRHKYCSNSVRMWRRALEQEKTKTHKVGRIPWTIDELWEGIFF